MNDRLQCQSNIGGRELILINTRLVAELRHHVLVEDAHVALDGVVFAFSTQRLMSALWLFDETFEFVLVRAGVLRLEEVLERVFSAWSRRPAVLVTLHDAILRMQSLVVGRRIDRMVDGIVLIAVRVTVSAVGNCLLQTLDDVDESFGIVDVL